MSTSSKPKVAIVQLVKQPFFDDMYSALIQSIQAQAEVRIVQSPEPASEIFKNVAEFPTVLLTDEALAKKKFRKQKDEAVLYVQNGGTLVVGCHFSGFTNMPELKSFFAAFGLPWEGGNYHRTTFSLNPAMPAVSHSGLPARQKALHLANVKQYDAFYLPTESSQIESVVRQVINGPEAPDDLTQTPAAFTKVGQGKIGYTGDVNGEDGTNLVTLAMLGLN